MYLNVTLTLDSSVYSLNVVQRVAYALASRLNITISQSGSSIIMVVAPTVIVGADTPLSSDTVSELIQRHLNDFALREQIQRETSGLREIIASAALRGAGV
ncbi:His-Xaa-Ser system protein HxsD [Pseudomonas sp. F3-2]|uniref:His-Xaa-Ser system protein HxsD n=1 Tax=Pseudomonas sp. F3-2 TaxID=3141539 RepID=UPI00315DA717